MKRASMVCYSKRVLESFGAKDIGEQNSILNLECSKYAVRRKETTSRDGSQHPLMLPSTSQLAHYHDII